MKRFIALCCAFCFAFSGTEAFCEEDSMQINCPSAILVEQSTNKVLYEKNADEKLPIASVTKIMTMLLIMEAIDTNKISMDDMVTVSQRAMSMGGSTMFLEEGESLSVYEMLKGICVASANDGCVAMAEFISGSEEAFVSRMNERAKELGMENTNFINTNGLDVDGHYSSARDVSKMSTELLKHEKILEFTTIWTDKMHDGKFDLSNTNKLIRFYPGANGLKTGSTDKAKCCISASAERNGVGLVAVILGADNSNDRFNYAKKLLDYGFANYSAKTYAKKDDVIEKTTVSLGVEKEINLVCAEPFSKVYKKGEEEEFTQNVEINKNIKAPIKKGDKLGTLTFLGADNKIVCQIDLVAQNDIQKKSFMAYLKELIGKFFGY